MSNASSYDFGSSDPESQEIVETFIDGEGREVEITRHAVKQWIKRSSDKFTDYDLSDAWEDSVSVGFSGATAKLFCPDDLVILMQGRRIRTAKSIHRSNLNTQHLTECSDCGYLRDGRVCSWCNHRLVATSNTDPELIGATSALADTQCSECTDDATHTVFWFTEDGLGVAARCDGHGHPSDADDSRKWAGELSAGRLPTE